MNVFVQAKKAGTCTFFAHAKVRGAASNQLSVAERFGLGAFQPAYFFAKPVSPIEDRSRIVDCGVLVITLLIVVADCGIGPV